jgi:hypothetical protein
MAELHVPEGFDLFTHNNYLTSVEESSMLEYAPLASLDGASSINFNCIGLNNRFKDISHVYLSLKLKLTKANNASFETTDTGQPTIAPSMFSLFKSLYVGANNINIFKVENLFHYKEVIDTYFSFSKEAGENRKSSSLFVHNNDFSYMKDISKNSKVFDCFGHINIPISKYILPLVDLTFRLDLEKPDFYLVQSSETKSELHILEAKLYVRHVTPTPALSLSIERALTNSPANYEFKKPLLLTQNLPIGTKSLNVQNLYQGLKPSFILCAFVGSKEMEGDLKSSPYKFMPFGLRTFSFVINGNLIPQTPLEFDVSDTATVSARMYERLFESFELSKTDKTFQITRKMFNNNFFFIAQNLSLEYNAFSNILEPPSSCNIGITGSFSEALTESVTVLAYLVLDSKLEIDKIRQINVVQ